MSIAADKPAEESPSKVTQQLLIKKAAEDAIAALEHGGDGNDDLNVVLSALKECGHENSAASRNSCDAEGRCHSRCLCFKRYAFIPSFKNRKLRRARSWVPSISPRVGKRERNPSSCAFTMHTTASLNSCPCPSSRSLHVLGVCLFVLIRLALCKTRVLTGPRVFPP
mmetsp:Transcript_27902/g.62104  ORF Transcript_27902/g.62104 Transcript_27902/m.62104 type:complete len:167 (-) Transcript_27902:145-645(-)